MSRSNMIRVGWLFVIAIHASVASAANDLWDGNGLVPPTGVWGVGANWVDNTTPGNSDTAAFNSPTAYNVIFNANPLAIQALTVTGGVPIFTSSGGARTLLVTSASGGQDVTINGGSFLTLGSAGNPLHLTAGDDVTVSGGSLLSITSTSQVNTLDLLLATASGGGNGTILVNGTGSELNVTNNVRMGLNGATATLSYLNNAEGTFTGSLTLADSANAASAATLNVVSGAEVTTGNLNVGTGSAATGTVNVNGTDASLRLTGASTITVGTAVGGIGHVNIGTTADGGTLFTGSGVMTINATGTVTIGNGANGGTLDASGDVTINGGALTCANGSFDLAPGKTLTIQNGGDANFDGGFTLNDGATSIVTGAGSTWNLSSSLFVGNMGSGALTISAGGVVSSSGNLGNTSSGVGEVIVTGAGSTWNGTGMTVGSSGSGTLTISAGGHVATTVGSIISNNDSAVGVVTVTGAGSTWNVAGMEIGRRGSGTVTISAGGAVSSGNAFVGNDIASSVGAVTVTGAGSTWTNSDSLYLGGDLTGAGGAGTVTILSGGTVSVAEDSVLFPGGRLNLEGGTLVINTLDDRGGLFAWTSGTLRLTSAGGLMIGPTGLFGSALLLNQNQTLNIDNALIIEADATLFAGGGLTTGSTAIMAGGELFVGSAMQDFGNGLNNSGDLVFTDPTTVEGPITNASGAAITALENVTFNDLVSGAGDFFGAGTITFNGGMAPGASPAAVSFEGGVVFGNTNTLEIELGGTSLGTEYDSLQIIGVAVLDGAIDVSLINGFNPALDDKFEIISAAGGVSGMFDTLAEELPALPSGLEWAISYGAHIVALQVVAAGLPGDYNNDGAVDAADYIIWRKNVGTTNPLPNDPIGGTIGAAQFDQWRGHFGQTSGGGSFSNTTVPEPTTILLMILGAALGTWRRQVTSRVPTTR